MIRRSIRIALFSALLVLMTSTVAAAASSDQIHKDAADGSIDGNYTLEEMRAADRSASSVAREYYGWEDVYNAYVRTLGSGKDKDTVVPAVPVDADRDGQIEPEEQAAATKKTKAKCTKASTKARKSKVCAALGVPATTVVDNNEAEDRDDDNKPASSKDDAKDDDGSPLIWLIVGIPVLIVLVGAWRFLRTRRRGPKDEFAA